MKGKLRIVFLGTPEFAVASLEALHNAGFLVAAVVTSPDAPAGRGQKPRYSPMKEYALEKGFPVLQPEKLKDPHFLEELKSYQADLQVVVAFRMLPEAVWAMPELGTFNLHASLLPQYRGAAPINWAIINGEKETGLTTFFLKPEIDTGNIIYQEKVSIGPQETAGELHDRLMIKGAELVVKTARAIGEGKVSPVSQQELLQPGTILKPAPKIFKGDCQIDWETDCSTLFNFTRGLSPYPAAYTYLKSPEGNTLQIKIFNVRPVPDKNPLLPGTVSTDGKRYLKIACRDGWLEILELQQAGKRKMDIKNFLMGTPVNSLYMAVTEYQPPKTLGK